MSWPYSGGAGIKLIPACRFLFIGFMVFALNQSNPTEIGLNIGMKWNPSYMKYLSIFNLILSKVVQCNAAFCNGNYSLNNHSLVEGRWEGDFAAIERVNNDWFKFPILVYMIFCRLLYIWTLYTNKLCSAVDLLIGNKRWSTMMHHLDHVTIKWRQSG